MIYVHTEVTENQLKQHHWSYLTFNTYSGNWYYEVRVSDLPEGAALRIGWAQKNANLQAPLGFDKFGYSCRSIDLHCYESQYNVNLMTCTEMFIPVFRIQYFF